MIREVPRQLETRKKKKSRLAVSSRVADEQVLGDHAVGKRAPATVGAVELELGDATRDDESTKKQRGGARPGSDREDVLDHRHGDHEGSGGMDRMSGERSCVQTCTRSFHFVCPSEVAIMAPPTKFSVRRRPISAAGSKRPPSSTAKRFMMSLRKTTSTALSRRCRSRRQAGAARSSARAHADRREVRSPPKKDLDDVRVPVEELVGTARKNLSRSARIARMSLVTVSKLSGAPALVDQKSGEMSSVPACTRSFHIIRTPRDGDLRRARKTKKGTA